MLQQLCVPTTASDCAAEAETQTEYQSVFNGTYEQALRPETPNTPTADVWSMVAEQWSTIPGQSSASENESEGEDPLDDAL